MGQCSRGVGPHFCNGRFRPDFFLEFSGPPENGSIWHIFLAPTRKRAVLAKKVSSKSCRKWRVWPEKNVKKIQNGGTSGLAQFSTFRKNVYENETPNLSPPSIFFLGNFWPSECNLGTPLHHLIRPLFSISTSFRFYGQPKLRVGGLFSGPVTQKRAVLEKKVSNKSCRKWRLWPGKNVKKIQNGHHFRSTVFRTFRTQERGNSNF